jgi:hypothetical protein
LTTQPIERRILAALAQPGASLQMQPSGLWTVDGEPATNGEWIRLLTARYIQADDRGGYAITAQGRRAIA